VPILPENRDRYPENWPQIRGEILARAGETGEGEEREEARCEWCGAENRKPHPVTGSMVVLTIAHLDHQPENCDPTNLRALCQKCHNGYDVRHRRSTRARNRVAAGQMELINGQANI